MLFRTEYIEKSSHSFHSEVQSFISLQSTSVATNLWLNMVTSATSVTQLIFPMLMMMCTSLCN